MYTSFRFRISDRSCSRADGVWGCLDSRSVSFQIQSCSDASDLRIQGSHYRIKELDDSFPTFLALQTLLQYPSSLLESFHLAEYVRLFVAECGCAAAQSG
jgi:hypothetical protein